MFKAKQLFWVTLIPVLTIMMLTGWEKKLQAQEKYPTKPIKMICPFSPGGGTDTLARIAADYLKEKWGVAVNVVNKTGGLGVPAVNEMYNSPPDGYTVLVDNDAVSYLLVVGVQDLPFDVMERTFINTLVFKSYVFMVPATSPHKTLADLMAEAKRDPEKFNYAVAGLNMDFAFRQLFTAFGFKDFEKAQKVITKGGAKSTALVAGGHVKLGLTNPSTCAAAVRAGTIRMLAVTHSRDPGFPDVPTTAELGYPSIDGTYWIGFSGPPKLPANIVKAWEDACQEMLKDPQVVSRLKKMGNFPFYKSSVEFRKFATKRLIESKKMFGLK